jgi:hypothetical protein
MTFHAVTSPANPNLNRLLKEACAARSLRCEFHDPATFDFTRSEPISAGDLLYRVAAPRRGSEAARVLEQHLFTEGVATFYQTDISGTIPYNAATITHQYQIFQREGLPLPATILYLTPDRSQLKRYVDFLGGFPVILKTTHGSHGIGTIRADSAPSLFSVLDTVREAGVDVLMQKYIAAASTARFIVIGSEVVDSIEYQVPPGDFRSNAGAAPLVAARKFDAALEAIAVKAVAALNLEAGGVDVLLDGAGKGYIAEVNFPFNFARAQMLTGVDTAGAIVDFLQDKSRRLTA